MALSPLAGHPAPPGMLVDPARLEREYYARRPDLDDPTQLVAFGTSGHRGSPLRGSFTEAHILAITQAICDYRRGQGIDGPLYMGKDTHAVSRPAERTALEVLAANSVETIVQRDDGVTPTPVISHAILVYNHGRAAHQADGIVVTPSHNPPEDGGFKYNPPNGGPADTDVTGWVERRANQLLREGLAGVKRVPFETAAKAPTTHAEDLVMPYVRDLRSVVDLDAVRAAGLRIAVDPLGGASRPYWEPINALYGLDITVVNPTIDPTFAFMTVDHDGKIRMDCSSPYAMARLVGLRDRYRLAFGNDPDADRHGIVTPAAGLMNPNHYLAVAVDYLLTHRPRVVVRRRGGQDPRLQRPDRPGDRRARAPALRGAGGAQVVRARPAGRLPLLRRRGERGGDLPAPRRPRVDHRQGRPDPEPAGRRDHRAHRAGSRRALRGPDRPARHAVVHAHRRAGHPAEKARLGKLSPESVKESRLAGEPITDKLTRAPGNGAPIGGLKVVAASGWFAARPSGTEDIYKIYAESFRDQAHLEAIVGEAQAIVGNALRAPA